MQFDTEKCNLQRLATGLGGVAATCRGSRFIYPRGHRSRYTSAGRSAVAVAASASSSDRSDRID